VIIEGGGTHYIDSCVFEGGRATQTYNFQKVSNFLILIILLTYQRILSEVLVYCDPKVWW